MPLGPTEIYIGIFLLIIYLVLLFSAGLMCFRRGHKVIGIAGFFFPPLWLAGALMKPKPKAPQPSGAASKSKRHSSQPTGGTTSTTKKVSQTSGSTSYSSHSSSNHAKKKRRRK